MDSKAQPRSKKKSNQRKPQSFRTTTEQHCNHSNNIQSTHSTNDEEHGGPTQDHQEQQAQIKELMWHNGILIAKVGTANPPPPTPKPGHKPLHDREYCYTDEDKSTARTLIAAINTGTKEATTSKNYMIYNRQPNTYRCFEL